jgi:hypothetical protein
LRARSRGAVSMRRRSRTWWGTGRSKKRRGRRRAQIRVSAMANRAGGGARRSEAGGPRAERGPLPAPERGGSELRTRSSDL